MFPLLKLSNLQKCLDRRLLLEVADIEVEQARCILVRGCNGSGKSTLLKILAGLIDPDRVDVQFQGQALEWRAARRRLRRNVVYLHQDPYLFDRSVLANLAYGLRQHGYGGKSLNTLVHAALQWADLECLGEHNARSLSQGERKRIALARAQIIRPPVLLLDEPTADLDPESRDRILFLVRQLKSAGTALVIASHESSRFENLADRSMEIFAGNLQDTIRNQPVERSMVNRRSSWLRKHRDSGSGLQGPD